MEDNQLTTNDSDLSNQSTLLPDTLFSNNMQPHPSSFTDEHEPPVANTHSPEMGNASTTLLLKEIRQLGQDFDTKIKYDESKERLIESLHRELQTYREGLHFRVLRPVFTDLITMYDDIGKLLDSLTAGGNLDQVVHTLTMYRENIEEILQRNGAVSFAIEGEAFLPSRQRILRVVPTADPALDKQVARRVRKGFMYEDIVLRAEVVETYKYTPASISTEES